MATTSRGEDQARAEDTARAAARKLNSAERVTRREVEERLADLPAERAERVRAALSPAPPVPAERRLPETPSPLYGSWQEYLARTTEAERRAWCARKAKRANRERLMSGKPEDRLSTADVVAVLESAEGRGHYCGSLAVENRPSLPNGAPLPWEQVGRRIGSLAHVVARVTGGKNTPANLVWSCLWCNTWPSERKPGATDRGAVRPEQLRL